METERRRSLRRSCDRSSSLSRTTAHLSPSSKSRPINTSRGLTLQMARTCSSSQSTSSTTRRTRAVKATATCRQETSTGRSFTQARAPQTRTPRRLMSTTLAAFSTFQSSPATPLQASGGSISPKLSFAAWLSSTPTSSFVRPASTLMRKTLSTGQMTQVSTNSTTSGSPSSSSSARTNSPKDV